MGKINVLDFEIANLIAAGEVVERPSSVLKELIENSIDSGADKIIAEIKRGGVSLIRVTDNGCGMERDDLPVALKRHATSKIRTRDDLDGITTLGFRGEALAAISSVSEVTIITKTRDAECGYMLTSEGGKILDLSEVGASDGTTVVVENLFFNVPARRKFLKKDSTEAMNVTALVERVALSRPDIAIQLSIDGEERFSTPGNSDLLDTIRAIYGRDFASKLIKADGTANGIRVHGYIGRSDNVKKNRNLENVFINGRYVKSLTAMAAIEKAYTSYIAPEAFPVCALFLEMDPTTVDVNVHPAKLEVKFASEQPVFEAVYHTVREAIDGYEYRPEMTLGARAKERNVLGAFVPIGENTRGEQISISTRQPAGETPRTATVGYQTPANSRRDPLGATSSQRGAYGSYNAQSSLASHRTPDLDKPLSVASGAGEGFAATDGTATMTPRDSVELLRRYAAAEPARIEIPETAASIPTKEKTTDIPEVDPASYRIIGEAFDCYVFVEYEGALLVIDKHAAHERVIFEELRRNREADGRVASQSLLLPITVILTPEEYAALAECADEIRAVGFELEMLDGSVNVTAIPDAISASDAEALLIRMLDDAAEGRGDPTLTEELRRERALYQIACKAAIKGGRVYDRSIIEWLVSRLLALPDITVCPHGRPVAYRLTKNELDRQFERLK